MLRGKITKKYMHQMAVKAIVESNELEVRKSTSSAIE